MNRNFLLPLVLLIGAPLVAEAREAATEAASAEASRPSASIEDAAFLVGDWEAEALGGITDESWSPARGGAMMGMFRLVHGENVAFYELFVLKEEAGSLLIQLKHFDGASFHGWEERDEMVEFPLARVAEDALYFDGISYRLTGPDSLTTVVTLDSGDGSSNDVEFRFRRRGSVSAGR